MHVEILDVLGGFLEVVQARLQLVVLLETEQGHRFRHQHDVQLRLVRSGAVVLLGDVAGYLQDVVGYRVDVLQQFLQVASVRERICRTCGFRIGVNYSAKISFV